MELFEINACQIFLHGPNNTKKVKCNTKLMREVLETHSKNGNRNFTE
jgi:hypothetical protein